jgi:hypothetical protein
MHVKQEFDTNKARHCRLFDSHIRSIKQLVLILKPHTFFAFLGKADPKSGTGVAMMELGKADISLANGHCGRWLWLHLITPRVPIEVQGPQYSGTRPALIVSNRLYNS